MRIEPAHIDQLRSATDGRMVLISADVGGVADELRRIDPGLKVRFAENGNPPFWAVYYESPDGRETYLVSTAKAYRTHSGIWTGLDHRIVDRVREADGQARNPKDFAAEIEANNQRVRDERHAKFREQVASTGELAAHAIRTDLGVKNRIFVKK